jgi:hypothetical protein
MYVKECSIRVWLSRTLIVPDLRLELKGGDGDLDRA